MKIKIYLPVSVEDELPDYDECVYVIIPITNFIYPATYNSNQDFDCGSKGVISKNNVTHWLKEIELDIPTDEEIFVRAKEYGENSIESLSVVAEQDFFNGAKYLREQITNQLKNK